MKKIRLNLDDLVVETFDTVVPNARQSGTIYGHSLDPTYCDEETCMHACETVEVSCNGSCGGTCQGTCVQTCVNTCGVTECPPNTEQENCFETFWDNTCTHNKDCILTFTGCFSYDDRPCP